jgi:hypothetical protein
LAGQAFSCLSRFLRYLGGHLKSLKSFKTQYQRSTEKDGVGASTLSLATMFLLLAGFCNLKRKAYDFFLATALQQPQPNQVGAFH